MEQRNQDVTAPILQGQHENNADIKAEEDHQSAQEIRGAVLYHFFAYRHFDQPSTCIDLINFRDADIDAFNLTATNTRALGNWDVLATYLQNLPTPTPETNTPRRRFIHHVRSFNATQTPHFRFYLCNLTKDDIQYLESLRRKEDRFAGRKRPETKLTWATSCVEDEGPVGDQSKKSDGKVDFVEMKKNSKKMQAVAAEDFKERVSTIHQIQRWWKGN